MTLEEFLASPVGEFLTTPMILFYGAKLLLGVISTTIIILLVVIKLRKHRRIHAKGRVVNEKTVYMLPPEKKENNTV